LIDKSTADLRQMQPTINADNIKIRKRMKGRGSREEARGKKQEGNIFFIFHSSTLSLSPLP